jgi:hypothetical protein
MPDRLIRDELLRSHRYRTLSSDTARLLFVHLLLSADALGNMEADSLVVGDALRRPVDEVASAKLLTELADADLVRLYESGGKRYLHIPRFRQRIRYIKRVHPRPPASIEDPEINELLKKVRCEPGDSQVQVARSEEKRSKEKRMRRTKIAFDAGAAKFVGVDDAQRAVWKAAYPRVDIDGELRKAAAWIIANPRRAPRKDLRRFLTSWLSRASESAPEAEDVPRWI